MRWTERDIINYAGPCPGCGRLFPAHEIDSETVAAVNRMGKPTGPRGAYWCWPCLFKDQQERVANAGARALHERVRRLQHTGLWDSATRRCAFESSDQTIELSEETRVKAYRFARSWRPAHGNVWLFGHGYGTGKTFLACAIANTFLDSGELEPAIFHGSQLNHLMKGYDSGEKLTPYRSADLLVFDDIDKIPYEPRASTGLYDVLDYRHNARLSTIVTANCSRSELCKRWAAVSGIEDAGRVRAALERLSFPGKQLWSIQIEGNSIRLSSDATPAVREHLVKS